MLKLIVALAVLALIVVFVRRQMKRAEGRKRHEARQLRQETEQQEWDEAMSRQRDDQAAPTASLPPSGQKRVP
jgi:type II secretory pathway pseudopilin PulG